MPTLAANMGGRMGQSKSSPAAIRSSSVLIYGRERLGDMARDDPEMLDLLLGALFHYNPS